MEEVRKAWAFLMANKLYLLFLVKALLSIGIARTTEFVPDEYWQSTEVSYWFYYERGHATWEWLTGLRSVLVPCLINNIYWFGDQLEIICPFFLTFFPQLAVTVMTLYAMYCFHQYVFTRYGVRLGNATMFLLGVNWFTTFCGSRLITNQIEMNLNCICLFLLYSNEGFNQHTWLASLLVINFMIRPTMGIFWLAYLPEVVQKFTNVRDKEVLVASWFFGIFTLFLAVYYDQIWYGKPVVTCWEFFKFNFLERGNADFGTHGPYWYLLSGLPSVFGPLVLLVPLMFRFTEGTFEFLVRVVPYIAIYSYLDHKEIRFLLPATPTMCLLFAAVLVDAEHDIKSLNIFRRKTWKNIKKFAIFTFVGLNLGATFFIGFHHQKGIKPAANFVYEKMKDVPFPRTWVMMPCYSLPINTYLHNPNADFKFYVCSPARFHHLLNRGEDNFIQKNGFDTVDIIADVNEKLEKSFAPHFILTYENVATTIQYAFRRKGYFYSECGRFRHTYVGDFHRFVVVLCASPLRLTQGGVKQS